MPKLDQVSERTGSRYPAPFDEPCRDRRWQALGVAAGLSQFGVNRVILPPGSWSSQRHWHALEDELVYLLDGELVLVEDGGETRLRPGDCAGFPAGVRNGHCLQNRSSAEAVFLVIGSRNDADWGEYPDIDMVFRPARYSDPAVFAHKDGKLY